MLRGAPRRHMLVFPSVRQCEHTAQHCAKAISVMPCNGQAAALFRPIWREGSDNSIAPRTERAPEPFNVGRLIGGLGKKVERCPVVPDIVTSYGLPCGHVSHYPFYLSARVSEACSSCRKRGLGKVEYGYIFVALTDERIDKPGSAATNINNGRAGRRSH